jgi:hypothetical protein
LTAGTFGTTGSEITLRLTVDAAAAKPQRDGASQATCSSPAFPVSGNTPPVMTTWKITATISSGIVFSEVSTDAEISRPRVIETIASTPMATISSTSGCCRNAPWAGSGRPTRPMVTITIACTPLIRPRITSLEVM